MTPPDPLPLAAAWTAGTSALAAWLAWIGVGGVGIRALFAVVVGAGLGAMAITGGGGTAQLALVGLAVAVAALARPRIAFVGSIAVAAISFPTAAASGWLVALGHAVLLGSITAGLCLGHWFLVDPHLPRRPMRILAGGGLVGLTLSTFTAVSQANAPTSGLMTVPVVVVAGAITAAVLVGALLALRVPTYKGVQSATGLFYVATMSVSAFVIVGSALAGS